MEKCMAAISMGSKSCIRHTKHERSRPTPKEKDIRQNDGEYVAFEEISVETIEQQPDSANFDMRNCKRESQISDAEFEDL